MNSPYCNKMRCPFCVWIGVCDGKPKNISIHKNEDKEDKEDKT